MGDRKKLAGEKKLGRDTTVSRRGALICRDREVEVESVAKHSYVKNLESTHFCLRFVYS